MAANDSDPFGIAKALNDLKTRTNDDAFVIIEALPSGKFVQFSKYANDEIYFNFPIYSVDVAESDGTESLVETTEVSSIPKDLEGDTSRMLSIDEEKRLKAYVSKWNLAYDVICYEGRIPNSTLPVSYFCDIEGDLTIDNDRYSEFIIGVFNEVYRLESGYEINVVEN